MTRPYGSQREPAPMVLFLFLSLCPFLFPFLFRLQPIAQKQHLVSAFVVAPHRFPSGTKINTVTKTKSKTKTKLIQPCAACSNDNSNDKVGSPATDFNWLEEWARQGEDAVALMKVQERTQRAMLAQLTEDRIYEITKTLDKYVDETTGAVSEEHLPAARELALQTRNLQREYRDLVTGAPSTLLETFSNLQLASDDDDEDNDKDNDSDTV